MAATLIGPVIFFFVRDWMLAMLTAPAPFIVFGILRAFRMFTVVLGIMFAIVLYHNLLSFVSDEFNVGKK
jgi:hypothetical protein